MIAAFPWFKSWVIYSAWQKLASVAMSPKREVSTTGRGKGRGRGAKAKAKAKTTAKDVMHNMSSKAGFDQYGFSVPGVSRECAENVLKVFLKCSGLGPSTIGSLSKYVWSTRGKSPERRTNIVRNAEHARAHIGHYKAKVSGKRNAADLNSAGEVNNPPAALLAHGQEDADNATPSKRSRGGRRDVSEKVMRNIANRLGHLPECMWQAKVNKEGLNIVDYVTRSMNQYHGDDKKLSSKFWTQLFLEYELSDSVAEMLPDPEEDLDVSTELLRALAAAGTGNPAGTPSSQLERYLQHCAPLNRSELFGLLGAVMESPQMPRSVAMKCQVAVLRYFARTLARQANITHTHSKCSTSCHANTIMLWG
jgi:hypothetical protein